MCIEREMCIYIYIYTHIHIYIYILHVYIYICHYMLVGNSITIMFNTRRYRHWYLFVSASDAGFGCHCKVGWLSIWEEVRQ